MTWFSTMTLKSKLLADFVTLAIIAGVIGGYGIYTIKIIATANTKLYEQIAVPLEEIADISIDFQRIRVNSRYILAAEAAEQQEYFIGRIKELRCSLEKNTTNFEKTLFSKVIVLRVLTDSVQEVVEMKPELIEPAPKHATKLNTEFIKGMGKVGEVSGMILDIDKFFTQRSSPSSREARIIKSFFTCNF